MDLPARIGAWDRALAAVRGCLRGRGMAEVSTPVRLPAVAIEPYIEPVAAEGGLLATSPELPMKQLLAAGAGAIFQVAHVLRAAEVGAHHAEEFHLIEWYRPGTTAMATLREDVEALVAAVYDAIGIAAPPAAWQTRGMLDLVAETSGVVLRGDEDADGLAAALARGGPTTATPTAAPTANGDTDAVILAAWTAFFSTWSDAYLDPWLAAQPGGVHVVEFPVALAALSRLGAPHETQTPTGPIALRLESHVAGVELANGYCELTDADVQQRRFEAVQCLREALGRPRLPNPEAFLAALRAPGLPDTVGCALGLDRLIAVACGADALTDIALPLDWSRPRPP